MAAKDFLPNGWAAFAEWFQNYTTVLPELSDKYAIPDAVLTSTINDNNWTQYWVQAKLVARMQEKQLTLYTDAIAEGDPGSTALTPPAWELPGTTPPEVAPGIRRRIRQTVNQIKNNPVYTEADGARLGIIAPSGETTPDDQLKAAFTAQSLANYTVSVEFKKQGADAMQFEWRKAGETNFKFVSTKAVSPAKLVFDAAAPTQIEIRAILVKKDAPVGAYSDIVTVTIAA